MNQKGLSGSIVGIVIVLIIAAGVGGYAYWRTQVPEDYDYYICENGIFYRTSPQIVDSGTEYFDGQGKKIGWCNTWGVGGTNCQESRAKAGGCTGPNGVFIPPLAVSADWKTYRNEEYGFEIEHPNNWELTDISAVNSGKQYIGVTLKSPPLLDLPGYENESIYYLIIISSVPGSTIETTADFASDKPGQQSPWNTHISDTFTERTKEYEIGQQIIASFKFST